ncbi:MAG TPA: branched-chain amino acid ABC transporter permease [Gaiellaceae bacterium]|nr:branched-chain amino acid ABC transporter permease [Gaiellaceae bacterium]
MRHLRGPALPRALLFAVAVVAVALLPRVLSDFRASQAALVAVYFVALLGLNVLTGYAGLVSLGHGAFMAIGGYVTAILVSDQGLELFGHTFSSDLRDVWTLPLAGLVAGVAGLLFGLPAVRLTGAYLALATFGIAVALPAVLKKAEALTGGSTGINLFGLPKLTGLGVETTVLGRTLTYNDWLYYICWGVALVALVVAWLLLRGRLGRAFRAVRDSEAAAVSSGVRLASAKTAAFGISAAYAGVAGGLYAMHSTFVSPTVFDVTLSIFLLVGVVVGGLGTLWAQVFGAAFIVFLPDVAQRLSTQPGVPSIVYAAVLIALMLLLPTGVGGLLRRALAPLTSRLYYRS